MDILDLLSPHTLSTEQLIKILKDRKLDIPNINLLDRGKILELYLNYVLPMHQRNSKCSSNTYEDDNLKKKTTIGTMNHRLKNSSNESNNTINKSRARIVAPDPILDSGCKKIKLVNTTNGTKYNGNLLKRTHNESVPETEVTPRKHKKITWP